MGRIWRGVAFSPNHHGGSLREVACVKQLAVGIIVKVDACGGNIR